MLAIKLVSVDDRKRVVSHLCKLKEEDRRLRFGMQVSDDYIKSYVENSWRDENSKWFGVIANGKVLATCHVAIYNNQAELGCSVDVNLRGKGLAQMMFDRAVTHIRASGIKEVYMHCLTENEVMRHIAKKNDMTVVSCLGETDARVEVKPATPMTFYRDAYLDRVAIYDMLFRSQAEAYSAFLEKFKNGQGTYITRSSS